ncbi:MAG: SIMPL domain-containing protein [Verrucomicrobiales bacterium]|nr:SIMPL domain-containing protein [Verrucomicrobiales bacterium]
MNRNPFFLLASLFAVQTLGSTCAQDARTPEPRSITVTGNAERNLPADRVRISVAIRSVREDLATARNASQEGFAAVVKGLGEIGVASEKIELENHSLGREYEDGPNGERIAKGFFSERQFMIELDDPSLLELVHGSLAGNAEVAVNQTSFSRKDEIEVRKELRKTALEAAKEKAMAMAAVYGQKIGRPLKMSEGGGFNHGMFTANNISTPVFGEAGGRVSLNALVEVTFELVD